MFHILGIRHHGPGSARSVCRALQQIQPDCILIEGPPDANALIGQLQHPDFKPPVALLLNTPIQKEDKPQASFYPFAEFSPEWQALQYAIQHQVAVEFLDLPLTHRFALEKQWQEARLQAQQATGENETPELETEQILQQQDEQHKQDYLKIRHDPIQLLAQQAGYQDSERFWEHLVEQQPHAGQMFDSISDAMSAVREYITSQSEVVNGIGSDQQLSNDEELEQYREAYMRKLMRQAEKQGYQNIVVVCGAWHAPALKDLKTQAKADTALLKGLPKIKVESAWIAWTHGRLSRQSGYGAGVEAVGWYAHLWKHYQQAHDQDVDGEKITIDWLSRFAQALRQAGHDASSAQIIDAVQLVQALLQLRGRRIPDLDDLFEVIQTVLHHGLEIPQPILAKLLQDEQLGQVPEDYVVLPIQQDFLKQVKHFRLKLEAPHREISLDLRESFDLAKSQFLHCVKLLGLAWAELSSYQSGQGNFKESWTLSWQPESSLYLNEMSIWGNSLVSASQNLIEDKIKACQDVADIAQWIEQILLSGLDQTLVLALQKLDDLSTAHQDPEVILKTLKPLIVAIRYGSVRQFSTEHLHRVVEHLTIRLLLGLPAYCLQLNAEMARHFASQLQHLYEQLRQLDQQDLLQLWQESLQQLLQQEQMQGYLHGYCVRLAREQQLIDAEQCQTFLARALSGGQTTDYSAGWFEGFLTHQALLLIHEASLWQIVDQWIAQLEESQFIELLPILARTASSFSPAEAQQLIQKIAQPQIPQAGSKIGHLDIERGISVLDEIYRYLQPKAV